MQILEPSVAIDPTTDANRPDVGRFTLLLAQLAGITWVVYLFAIESKAFLNLLTLTTVGFAIHYFLPLRHRLRFFLLLSICGIVLVVGPIHAMWIVGIGLVLIGIAHLPLRMAGRVALLLAVSGGLVFARAGNVDVPWSGAVWPILGSMFMFRMIVYMYDLASGLGAASVPHRLSYFFLLPNVCFPLFPVVDFRTFVRTYYSAPRHEIYQVGLEWMIRGVVQLLLYRFVQVQLAVTPYDVDSLPSLAHYFIWLYLLYLLVSGQFHLIVGMLHLFGFNLPETHRRYYLASSFTDFWRRINIYWKDFMMKVFYYPIYFRLRRLGPTPALVLSIASVFLVTWALHAVQGFWIRGFLHFSWNDSLFWAILGILVVLNSLYEARHGRRRSLSGKAPEVRGVLVAKTAATFAALCLLWSFWSSESVASWLSLWPAAMEHPLPDRATLIVILGIGAGLVAALWLGAMWLSHGPHGPAARGVVVIGWIAMLAILWVPTVEARLGAAGRAMAGIRVPRLNAFQLEELERGYYEDLMAVDRFNRELGSLYARRPPDWETTLGQLGVHRAGAEPGDDLVPNAAVQFKGTVFRTNRWGMHDQDYSLEPGPGTYRVALIGASHSMGWGVPEHATFEALLEQHLNRDPRSLGAERFEILNFSMMNFTAFEQIRLLDRKVTAFSPDAVWYVGHPYEVKRLVRHIRRSWLNPTPGEQRFQPWFQDLARRARIDEHTSPYLAERRLASLGDEIVFHLLRTIGQFAEVHGMRAVYVHLPLTPESRNEIDETPYVDLARRAGFATIDLTGVYDGHPADTVWLAEWDAHPNQLGHRLVADRLFELVRRDSRTILDTPRLRQSPPPLSSR